MTSPKVNPAIHIFIALCALFFLLFFIWAYQGKLDIVSVADGVVMPSSKVKRIQHLEGGIIKEIIVSEGERVKRDQPLVILEKTPSRANVDELKARINALSVDVVRLKAEIAGAEVITFPAELKEKHPRLTQQSRDLFQARRDRFHSEFAGLTEKVKQRQQDIDEITVRLKNNKHRLALIKQQLAISEELLKDQLTTQYNHLDLLRETAKIQSSIDEDSIARQRAVSSLQEAKAKLQELQSAYQAQAETEVKEVRQNLEELSLRLRKYSDSLQRTVIRSPVEGVVKTLYIVTKGGVVTPGMTILEIVPAVDMLVIEARLHIADIGYVRPGQRAVIRLASRDARRFGNLEGKVVDVSPDAFFTEKGKAFYNVRIETEKDYFEKNSLRYQLYPGVLVKASIHTGRRTVLEYLLDPFLDTFSDSMRER